MKLPTQRLIRLTLLFEVYPGKPYACDTANVVCECGAHVQELLHPDRAVDADVKDAFLVEVEYVGVLCQGGAAGDTPGGGQTVFV